jgi:Holliday junction resolvasome RuvABC DNA-binding subunit
MIRGEDKFCAEQDRIVNLFRQVKNSSESSLAEVSAAWDAAIEGLHKLGYTRGEAHEILARPIRIFRTARI